MTGESARLSRLNQPRVAVPLLLAVAVVLRLPNLGESLWFDEVAYSTHFRYQDLSRFWAFLLETQGPPLYSVLLYVWAGLFGDHEVVVRLPSVICGLASIALTFLIARRYADGWAPVLAGLFLCLSPVHVWYSQEAAPYAMAVTCVLAAVYLWPFVAADACSRTHHRLYVAALLAAPLTHYYAAIVLPVFMGLSLWTHVRRPGSAYEWSADPAGSHARRRILMANMLAGTALAGWLAFRYAMSGELPGPADFLRTFTASEWRSLFFHWFVDGYTLWDWGTGATLADLWSRPGLLALQAGFAVLLLLGLWPGQRTSTRAAAGELASFVFALPLAVYLLSFSSRSLYLERYLLMSLPFFAIAVARGATHVSLGHVRIAVACLVIGIEAASYAALLRKDDRWTVYKPNPDWRAAATFVASQYSDPEQLVIEGTVPLTDFHFYLTRQWSESRPRVQFYVAEDFERLRLDGRAPDVVLVHNLYWPNDDDRRLEEFRSHADVRFTKTTTFKGVRLHTFVPR